MNMLKRNRPMMGQLPLTFSKKYIYVVTYVLAERTYDIRVILFFLT